MMTSVEGRMFTSSDPCVSIVHGLLRYRKGDESDPFPKKAIESLVRKLKEKRDELDELIVAVTMLGEQATKCVTIPRTLDGRLQVATRKGFPHVVYARIWRWPDVHKNEMKHREACQFAFDLKRDAICINPYHYERIVPAGIDLTGLSLHQSVGEDRYMIGDDCLSPYQRLSASDALSPLSDTSGNIHDRYVDVYSPQQDARAQTMSVSHPHQLLRQLSQPTDTSSKSAWMSPSSPVPAAATASLSSASSSSSWPGHSAAGPSAAAGAPEMPILIQQSPVNIKQDTPTEAVPWPTDVTGSFQLRDNVTYVTTASDIWRSVTSSSDGPSVLLSSRPLPDVWCSITYFELDHRVGEIFKVPLSCPVVSVDGYTNPSSRDRFCLGKLTSVQRTDAIEKARLHIGKGVQLVLEGEGDVWVRCLSDHSIFVQSYYLDRESGRQPGDVVHKIYPAAFIKVFDLNQCYSQMRQWAAMSRSAAITSSSAGGGGVTTQLADIIDATQSANTSSAVGIGADDLRRLCVLRLSFVKGWGPDYPRPTIKDTPCWIEIQLHRPLQLLDEVLQMMMSGPADETKFTHG